MAANNTKHKPPDEAPVGYGHPPAGGQFRKGRSGNPKGRPKGRPNVASLTRLLFNEPVLVRQGGKTSHMPTAEAVFRSLVAQAARGDARALFTVMDILEMTGRTNDISDEERAKRAMHLPASMSLEEMDLVRNQTCQKDRERCRMMVESNPERFATDGTPMVLVPALIQAGDRLAADRKFDDALAAYRQEVAACKVDFTADRSDKDAQERFRRAVARIGLVADALLLVGEFERAITVAEEALAEGTTPFWVNKTLPFFDNIITTGTTWISAIRAHALMLSGRDGPARAFYHSFKGDPKVVMTSWETSILRDFVRLRKAGLSHPLMDEIEKRYTDEGWTTDIRNTKSTVPKMKPELVGHFSNSDQIKDGDKLRESGYVHEALTVYLRNLRNWQKNVAKDGTRDDWKQSVATTADRIALAIQDLFYRGKFISALESADKAAGLAPGNLVLHAVRACALLLNGGHDNEARALFMRHRDKTVGNKTWEALIADKFAELRRMGCGRPLMDEIENRFVGAELSEFPDVDVARARADTKEQASALAQATDLISAKRLQDQERLEDALMVYGRFLQAANAKIDGFATGQFNIQVVDDRKTASDNLADLAISFLTDRNFTKALEAIDLALSADNAPQLHIWRAHALMFLGRLEEARTLYLRCRDERVDARDGTDVILNDFASLRRGDLSHPLMDEIETLFTARKISR